MLNWIKGERSGKRGHTYRSECGRFVIEPVGASGRFLLWKREELEEGQISFPEIRYVIVRGRAVGTCKSVAQQLVDEEEREALNVITKEDQTDFEAMQEAMADEDTQEMDAIFKTETMPSAERRTKGETGREVATKTSLTESSPLSYESELTTGIETLESNTQRNVEPIKEGENMPSATAVSQEPMILSEADARRLAKAMNLPESEWTTKRLQTKFNKLDELVAEGATEVTEREDKVLLKEISRQLQEWDGEGHAVQIASNGESNGEATEEAQEAPTRPAKAAKEPKAVPLPNPPRKIVYEQADPPPKTFTQDEMKSILGWREVRKKDAFHFKYQIGDTPKYVALDNCLTNRQFRFPLAKRYAAEHIRKKWSFNGETIVLDKYGCVQQGMHRGAGFVLAEEQRAAQPEKWGKKALTYTTGFQTGIEPANDVVDTIDLGQKRSLGDVLFRNRDMGKEFKDKELAKLSRILAGAIRLVWLRITGVSVMGGQAFLHSEALELLKEHEDLVDCVKFIHTEEGGSGADGKKISNYISLAYASGLMYLMAKAKGGKKAAEEFWTLFAGGAFEKGDPILALRESLKRRSAGSGAEREKIIGTVIKAWQLWSEGKKNVKPSDIVVKKDEDPRFGGIDKEKSE